MGDYLFLIPLFPLLGVLINGLFGRRFPERLIGWLGSLMIFGSFVVSVAAFVKMVGMDPMHRVIESPSCGRGSCRAACTCRSSSSSTRCRWS